MKFTKQQAFESLKGELAKGGKTPRLSDRSINDYVENLLEIEADNEELELDAFVAKYKKTLLSMNGNVEHDVSSGVNDFKTQWEKDHPAKQEPKDTTKSQEPSKDEDPQLKAILDRLKNLEDENNAMKEEKSLSQKKKDLLSKMKEKGIDNDDWSNGIVAQIQITPDLDVDAKAGELLEFYNKTMAYTPHMPATPGSTNHPREQENSSIAAAAAIAKQQREAEQNK